MSNTRTQRGSLAELQFCLVLATLVFGLADLLIYVAAHPAEFLATFRVAAGG